MLGSIETTGSSSQVLDTFVQFEMNFPHILESSHIAGQGWLVAENCNPQDYELFDEFIRSTMNTKIPRSIKTSFIDGMIYIKKIPHRPHEQAVEAMREQLFTVLNTRLHEKRRTFYSHGSADHGVGGGGQAQVDVSVVRAYDRRCPNMVVEISGTGMKTSDLIPQCRKHLECENIQYVLGIDILPLVGTNAVDRQIRLCAHLFQQGGNDNLAPISITSFGNMPLTQAQGNSMRNHLIAHYYRDYEHNILFRGVGFDVDAPPCNQRNIPYFELHLDPTLLLQNHLGIPDYTGISPQALPNLAALLSIDLYITQTYILGGFVMQHLFPGPQFEAFNDLHENPPE